MQDFASCKDVNCYVSVSLPTSEIFTSAGNYSLHKLVLCSEEVKTVKGYLELSTYLSYTSFAKPH